MSVEQTRESWSDVSDHPIPDPSGLDLLKILRALGDPIRLDIVTVLADGAAHPKRTDDWGAGVTKSTMSHHFKVLREAGLTRTLVDGRNQSCQLRRAELDERFPGLIDALTRDSGGAAGDRIPSQRSEVMRHYVSQQPSPAPTEDPGTPAASG